jgi:hypothetical protein
MVSTTVVTSLKQTTRTSPANEDSRTGAQEETQPIETSSIESTTVAAETTSDQEISTLNTTLAADSTSSSTSTSETSTTENPTSETSTTKTSTTETSTTKTSTTETSTTETSTTTPAPYEFTNSAPYVLAPMAADPEAIAAQADSDFANAMLGIPSSFSAPFAMESADGNYR